MNLGDHKYGCAAGKEGCLKTTMKHMLFAELAWMRLGRLNLWWLLTENPVASCLAYQYSSHCMLCSKNTNIYFPLQSIKTQFHVQSLLWESWKNRYLGGLKPHQAENIFQNMFSMEIAPHFPTSVQTFKGNKWGSMITWPDAGAHLW